MVKKTRILTELLEFYRNYPIDHWIYKVTIFKNIIDNYDLLKDTLLKGLIDIIDKDCINMLKAEIHFTYFQMVEALFELIFALERRKDKLLWLYLSTSPYKNNFKRITKISNENTDFFFKDVELPSGKSIPYIQYVFYFGAFFPVSDTVMKSNLEKIKKFLIICAKDFSNRSVYNSYKHSLRFYQSPISLEILELLDEEKFHPILKTSADDTFSFLCRDKKGNIELRRIAFDPERDINMINTCHHLIQNLINLRKRYFFTPKEKAKACMFDKIDIDTLNHHQYSFIESKSVFLLKKEN